MIVPADVRPTGRFAMAPTDPDWLAFLARHPQCGHVNFWTPSDWGVRGIPPGGRFYFVRRGHEPRRIAGYGAFVRYELANVRDVWARYGIENGASSLEELFARLAGFRAKNAGRITRSANPTIGCLILADPVFFTPSEEFLPEDIGVSFSRHVVKPKYLDVSAPRLARAKVPPLVSFPEVASARLADRAVTSEGNSPHSRDAILADILSLETLDAERLSIARREQGHYRELLLGPRTTASCALCGVEFPADLLVAAHIKRRADCTDAERRDVANNLMLACTFGCDELFERGYLVVRNGRVDSGPCVSTLASVANRVAYLRGKKCGHWSPRSAPYFKAHAERHARSHDTDL